MSRFATAASSLLARVTGNTNLFGTLCTFTDRKVNTATVSAFIARHHLAVNNEGAAVSSLTAHLTVSEELLIAAGYEVRNEKKEVNMNKHIVTFTDVSGNERTYQINQQIPSDTVGMLTFTLTTTQLA